VTSGRSRPAAPGRSRTPDPVAAETGRRPLVPGAGSRPLWFAAAWTGVGAAFVAAVIAIVVVAICWLPAAGTSGSASSAIRAGLLTFLAGLHGGITVDGLPAAFVPLGITAAIGALAWRAGAALADAADESDERSARRLTSAALVQLGAFAATAGVVAGFAGLGTSHVTVVAAVLGGGLLWLCTGTAAVVRFSPLGEVVADLTPPWLARAVRLAVADIAVYLAAGALLAAGSLGLHWSTVVALSRELGGGWSSLPVLLLGMLAAPNAAIAGAGYLAGPGFAVGTGTVVRLDTAARGRLPDFPLLGALPQSPAGGASWMLVAATPLIAGCCLAVLARRTPRRRDQWRDLGAGLLGAAVLGMLIAVLADGGIGSGRLAAIGVSPWQFGFAVAVGGGVGAIAVLATLEGFARLRHSDIAPVAAAVSELSARLSDPAAARRETPPAASRPHTSADSADGPDALAG